MLLSPKTLAVRILAARHGPPANAKRTPGTRGPAHLRAIHPRTGETISLYLNRYGPNHHLCQFYGIWYLRYLTFPTPETNRIVRRSLRTLDVQEARRRRDEFFAPMLPRRQESSARAANPSGQFQA